MARHVFISYKHGADGAYVEKLAAHLGAAGFDCWLDRELITGARWTDVVAKQVSTCDVFVVVMTPAAHASEWVDREIKQAQRTGRPILPLLLDGEPFFALLDLQAEDVRDGIMPSPGFLTQLAKLTGVSPRLPATPAPRQVSTTVRAGRRSDRAHRRREGGGLVTRRRSHRKRKR